MTADNHILSLQDLTLGYPGRGEIFHRLRAVALPGELVALLGPNGAGKSTLLRAIGGVTRPACGRVAVLGQDICRLSAMRRARLVSVVTTERPGAGALTVTELVAMGRYPHTGALGRHTPADRRAVADAIAAVGLTHLAGRLTATLSDGERQKAMIARALAQDTPLMLLDEPTAFLDAASRIETLSLLRSLAAARGKAIILSTHDVAPALRLAHRLWLVRPADTGAVKADSPEGSESAPARASTLIAGTPAALAADSDGLPALFPGRPVAFSPAAGDYLPL